MNEKRRFVPACGPLESRRLQTSLGPRVMQLTGPRGRPMDMILIPPGSNVAAARAELSGSLGGRGTQAVVLKMANSGGAMIFPLVHSDVYLVNGPATIEVGTGKFVRDVRQLKLLPFPLRQALDDQLKWREWERFVNG